MKNLAVILSLLTFFMSITQSQAVPPNCATCTCCSSTSKCPPGTKCAISLTAPSNVQIGCCLVPKKQEKP